MTLKAEVLQECRPDWPGLRWRWHSWQQKAVRPRSTRRRRRLCHKTRRYISSPSKDSRLKDYTVMAPKFVVRGVICFAGHYSRTVDVGRSEGGSEVLARPLPVHLLDPFNLLLALRRQSGSYNNSLIHLQEPRNERPLHVERLAPCTRR